MGSTRLPGKVLKPVSGKPILWHMFNRLKFTDELDQLVLATSDLPKDDPLEEFAKGHGVTFFRGSEEDVLNRYYKAAKEYKGSVIVRLTGDCPLIDPKVTDKVVRDHFITEADYAANTIKRTYPRGLDTEVFNFEVLEKAEKNATESYEREHVTPYIRERPHDFRLNTVVAEGELRRPDLRLTVDQEEDLALIREIFDHFYQEGEIFETKQVIDFLDENPDIASINEEVKQKEVKE